MHHKQWMVSWIAFASVSFSCAAQDKTAVPYTFKGPYGIGDPVHEVLTLLAVGQAIEKAGSNLGDLLAPVKRTDLPSLASTTDHKRRMPDYDLSVHQFLRGVVWPDDPKGWVFTGKCDCREFSWGIDWLREFKKADLKPENLIARSHFGDLQFIHSMSPLPDSPPSDVRQKIIDWAQFCTTVAMAQVTDTAELLKAAPQVGGWFPRGYTVRHLFVADTKSSTLDVRQRAAGALMHLVQDSYAKCHTLRDDETGAIRCFLCYAAPDHDHAVHDDSDRFGEGPTLGDKLKNTHGACNALERCTHLLGLLDRRAPEADVLAYINLVFELHKEVKVERPKPR